jgi:probable HAF family extracellular repeat protein
MPDGSWEASMSAERSEALAIDEEGRVVGTSRGDDRKDHGFLWEGGRMRDLAPIERAVGIDGRGRILGNRSSPAPAMKQALLWVDGEVSSLASLGVDEFVVAQAINARGQAVGSAGVFGPAMERRVHAFLWEDGRMRDLTPDAVYHSGAGDISDAGHVVGALLLSDVEAHAFVWMDGRLRDLGTFGGRSASAVAVDDRGRFVVNVIVSEGDPPREGRALLVDGDRVIDLGKLREDDRKTEAHAMNDHGVVVGQSGERAFVREDGTIRKLPSPVACQEPDPGPPRGRPIVPKAPGDVDGDGVGDKDDLCPHTPEGATPDRHGCPMDTDDDGVMDGLDQCPDTARGAIADRRGCPME